MEKEQNRKKETIPTWDKTTKMILKKLTTTLL
jgi:hypothetical protein